MSVLRTGNPVSSPVGYSAAFLASLRFIFNVTAEVHADTYSASTSAGVIPAILQISARG